MSQTLGLYIHIPFCRSKCAYCDFYSLPECNEAVWDQYVKALVKHIKESAVTTAAYPVDSVFFGGGTPSLLGAKRLCVLLDAVRKFFRLSANAEITLEGNPESLNAKEMKKLRRGGFNRLSVGVQSLDDDMLRILNRPHHAADAINAVRAAREAGFENLGIDLLFGLPGQTPEDWADTLRAGLELQPDHMSCYGLTLEKETPLYQIRQNYRFPDGDAQADMFLLTADTLCQSGYRHYEISNFSRPGFECRHNLKYWTLQPYLGLGPAAHSDFGGRRWSHIRDLNRYIAGVNRNDTLIDHIEDIPPSERAGEYLMLGLRTAHGVSGREYERQFRRYFDAVESRLETQRARGLAARDGDRWRLTERGFLLSNRVIGEVLETN